MVPDVFTFYIFGEKANVVMENNGNSKCYLYSTCKMTGTENRRLSRRGPIKVCAMHSFCHSCGKPFTHQVLHYFLNHFYCYTCYKRARSEYYSLDI